MKEKNHNNPDYCEYCGSPIRLADMELKNVNADLEGSRGFRVKVKCQACKQLCERIAILKKGDKDA